MATQNHPQTLAKKRTQELMQPIDYHLFTLFLDGQDDFEIV